MADSQVSITDDVIQVMNDLVKQDVTPDRIQCYNIHHESILQDLFTNNDLYDDDSYASYDDDSNASYTDWKIQKTSETDLKKLECNIDKPETDLERIEFNINVNNGEINSMNDKEAVYINDGLADNNNNNIEDHGAQHEQIDRNNCFYTLVEKELQQSHQLEDQNEADDWKTTNKHEGKLAIAYNNNASNKTLFPRTFYVLYIVLNDSGTGHFIFNLST